MNRTLLALFVPLALTPPAAALQAVTVSPVSPLLAQADPFARVWTRLPSGRLPTVDQNNGVLYTVKHAGTAADRVQFVLVLGAGTDAGRNIYRKSLFVTTDGQHRFANVARGTVLNEAGTPFSVAGADPNAVYLQIGTIVSPDWRAGTFSLARQDITAVTQLLIRKDNFMGGFTTAAVLRDLEYLQGGDVVTIVWEREQN